MSIIGRRFGCVVVVEALHVDDNGQRRYRCRCDCGATTSIAVNMLRARGDRRRSCPACRGDRRLDRSHHPGFKDMTGQRIGSLVVAERLPNHRDGSAVWRCVCDCGHALDARGIKLRSRRPPKCPACRIRRSASCATP